MSLSASPTPESQDTQASRLLTVAQAAERMGVGERFVRRLVFERRIAYQKLGGFHVRIAESDVDQFIASSRIEAQA